MTTSATRSTNHSRTLTLVHIAMFSALFMELMAGEYLTLQPIKGIGYDGFALDSVK